MLRTLVGVKLRHFWLLDNVTLYELRQKKKQNLSKAVVLRVFLHRLFLSETCRCRATWS